MFAPHSRWYGCRRLHRVPIQDRVSLADLLSTPIVPTARDAVALIVQLAHSPQMGRPIRARLDASHVWLHADGAVTLSPGLLPPLPEVAALLGDLLGRVETASGMPLGLVSIVERAALQRTGFTIPSLSAFAAALEPFQPPDPAAAVRALVVKLDDVPPVVADVPMVAAGDASEVVLEPPPPTLQRPLPAPLPEPLPEPEPESPPAPLPALPPALPSPAVAVAREVTPEVAARPWRPSRWHVTGAIAATLIAALLGGVIGRSRHGGAVGQNVPSATSSTATREAPPPPRTVPAPGPEMEVPPPSRAGEPAPPIESPPARPVSLRPARLVDRHTLQADAVFSPSFAADGSAVYFHAEEGSEQRAEARRA